MYLKEAGFAQAVEACIVEVEAAAAHLALQDVLAHDSSLLADCTGPNAQAAVWTEPATPKKIIWQSQVLN